MTKNINFNKGLRRLSIFKNTLLVALLASTIFACGGGGDNNETTQLNTTQANVKGLCVDLLKLLANKDTYPEEITDPKPPIEEANDLLKEVENAKDIKKLEAGFKKVPGLFKNKLTYKGETEKEQVGNALYKFSKNLGGQGHFNNDVINAIKVCLKDAFPNLHKELLNEEETEKKYVEENKEKLKGLSPIFNDVNTPEDVTNTIVEKEGELKNLEKGKLKELLDLIEPLNSENANNVLNKLIDEKTQEENQNKTASELRQELSGKYLPNKEVPGDIKTFCSEVEGTLPNYGKDKKNDLNGLLADLKSLKEKATTTEEQNAITNLETKVKEKIQQLENDSNTPTEEQKTNERNRILKAFKVKDLADIPAAKKMITSAADAEKLATAPKVTLHFLETYLKEMTAADHGIDKELELDQTDTQKLKDAIQKLKHPPAKPNKQVVGLIDEILQDFKTVSNQAKDTLTNNAKAVKGSYDSFVTFVKDKLFKDLTAKTVVKKNQLIHLNKLKGLLDQLKKEVKDVNAANKVQSLIDLVENKINTITSSDRSSSIKALSAKSKGFLKVDAKDLTGLNNLKNLLTFTSKELGDLSKEVNKLQEPAFTKTEITTLEQNIGKARLQIDLKGIFPTKDFKTIGEAEKHVDTLLSATPLVLAPLIDIKIKLKSISAPDQKDLKDLNALINKIDKGTKSASASKQKELLARFEALGLGTTNVKILNAILALTSTNKIRRNDKFPTSLTAKNKDNTKFSTKEEQGLSAFKTYLEIIKTDLDKYRDLSDSLTNGDVASNALKAQIAIMPVIIDGGDGKNGTIFCAEKSWRGNVVIHDPVKVFAKIKSLTKENDKKLVRKSMEKLDKSFFDTIPKFKKPFNEALANLSSSSLDDVNKKPWFLGVTDWKNLADPMTTDFKGTLKLRMTAKERPNIAKILKTAKTKLTPKSAGDLAIDKSLNLMMCYTYISTLESADYLNPTPKFNSFAAFKTAIAPSPTDVTEKVKNLSVKKVTDLYISLVEMNKLLPGLKLGTGFNVTNELAAVTKYKNEIHALINKAMFEIQKWNKVSPVLKELGGKGTKDLTAKATLQTNYKPLDDVALLLKLIKHTSNKGVLVVKTGDEAAPLLTPGAPTASVKQVKEGILKELNTLKDGKTTIKSLTKESDDVVPGITNVTTP